MKQYSARELATLALSDDVHTLVTEILRRDPGNPLAITLRNELPYSAEECEEFDRTLRDRSIEDLEALLKIAPGSFIRFRIVEVLHLKKGQAEYGTLGTA